MKPISKDDPQYTKLENAVKRHASEWMIKTLKSANHVPQVQLRIAETFEEIANRLGGTNAIPTLGETILVQQAHKVAQWKEKAYPLSDNQIEAVVRDILAGVPKS